MPDSFSAGKILEYGWLSLLALGGYIFKGITRKIDTNTKTLIDHVKEDQAMHDNFVHKDDWMEFKNALYARFDKIDIREEKILDKIMNGVDRTEFKSEIGVLYAKLDSLEQRKADR